jgi:hypothetical protein
MAASREIGVLNSVGLHPSRAEQTGMWESESWRKAMRIVVGRRIEDMGFG